MESRRGNGQEKSFNNAEADFVVKMKSRMVISFYKYGPVIDNYGSCCVNAMGSMYKRIRKYSQTHNTEWLVDVANFAMIEFMCPQQKETSYDNSVNVPYDDLLIKEKDVSSVLHNLREKYKKTGNLAFVVDMANIAMIEFEKPQFEDAYFSGTDSKESPGLDGIPINEMKTL